MYTTIINAIIAQYDKYMNNGAEYIRTNDSTLQRESTATRWNQYKNGVITREKCAEYAIARQRKSYTKSRDNSIAHAERISNAPEIKELTISINWTRSSTWGYNPHATITVYCTNGAYFTAHGKASGCGYDKRSAAVAEAMNQIDACLKIIYNQRENGVSLYGSGRHNAYPYFEGGVGIDCYHTIMKEAGFEKVSDHGTKTTDFYHYVKK